MKKIDDKNVFDLNNQYLQYNDKFYYSMFLQDFHYFIRNRINEKYITYTEKAKKKIINAENDETCDMLLEIINRMLVQLLIKGKSNLLILDYNKNNKDVENRLLLCNIFIDKNINCFKNSYFHDEKLKFCKIEKKRIISFNLREAGYNINFFSKSLKEIEKKHEFLMDNNFIFSSIDHKKVYKDNDIEELLLTKKMYWDCRNFDNNSISLPYLYFRKEKFYNIRIRILKYIINKINKSLSKFLKCNIDFINISDKICELDLYNQYIKNEISLNELQNEFYINAKI